MVEYVIGATAVLSMILNIYLLTKKQIKQTHQNLELDLFLKDLRSGSGLLKVDRIDPKDVYLRR